MSAVAKLEPQEVVAPVAEATAIIQMIERAASNPAVDMDKMVRLLDMRDRVVNQEAELAYNDAMSQAQEELRPVSADASNPQTKSKYASYAALDKAVRPIYTKHGFALSFYTGEGAPPDYVRVACKVSRGLYSERPFIDMPADGKGAKGGDVMTKTHAVGAAFSYGQRYLLKLIFNIAIGDDDDGNAPNVRAMSAAATAAISAINDAESLAKLQEWKRKNQAGLEAFEPSERREIIALYSRRQKALRPDVGASK